jgi:hypothetical protein
MGRETLISYNTYVRTQRAQQCVNAKSAGGAGLAHAASSVAAGEGSLPGSVQF